MDDLVERLRDAGYVLVSPGFRKLAHEAAARIQALETSLAEAKTWRDAVDNALVTDWLGTADSFPDARTALDKLIEWHMTIAVDPAVSKPAADLVAEAEGRVKWVFPKSIADMPVKPGKAAYEYVECLILRKGEMLCRPWNCEHQVFDDEAQDDFFCEWSEVTAYMELTTIRALADPLLDRQGE